MAARQVGGDTYGGYRARLIEALRQNGISDMAVLRAVGEVPRHLFVPEAVRHRAYEDVALPIGRSQTISQPSTQALYLQTLELRGNERALEIGTGSGYQTALLSMIVESVLSVERVSELAERARKALTAAGVRNATVVVGDGTLGWSPLAPYDTILVSAAGPTIPDPLLDQLAVGGKLIAPVASAAGQSLVLIRRSESGLEQRDLGGAKFVPLIGRHGFGRRGGS